MTNSMTTQPSQVQISFKHPWPTARDEIFIENPEWFVREDLPLNGETLGGPINSS